MKYGHRRDVLGYAEALNSFDLFIGRFTAKMNSDDILFITADHGCDPAFSASTDHTREYTPLLIYSKNIVTENFGTRSTFADISATISSLFGLELSSDGKPINIKFK
jgi:phosphopentomutase